MTRNDESSFLGMTFTKSIPTCYYRFTDNRTIASILSSFIAFIFSLLPGLVHILLVTSRSRRMRRLSLSLFPIPILFSYFIRKTNLFFNLNLLISIFNLDNMEDAGRGLVRCETHLNHHLYETHQLTGEG